MRTRKCHLRGWVAIQSRARTSRERGQVESVDRSSSSGNGIITPWRESVLNALPTVLRVNHFMTRRELLFTDQTIQHVHSFYDFHRQEAAKTVFDSIIREPYSPKLKTHPRGFSDLVPPYESTLQDLEENLGRSSWSLDDEKTIKLVKPGFRSFDYCEKKIIIYENESCRVKAYENKPDHLHILLANSRKSTLATFRKFKQLLSEMRGDYKLITAHIAETPCKITGLQNDWRFEKNSNGESRLLRYWRRCGFISCDNNKNVVKIET